MSESFTITGQREVIDLDAQGGAVRAMEITFTSLPSQTVATVRIPIATYTAATARAAIEARSTEIEAVHAL